MQKHVNLVDIVKSFPTNMFLQHLASIQKRTSPIKFAHLAEKSEKGSIPNLSTKVRLRSIHDSFARVPRSRDLQCAIVLADAVWLCRTRGRVGQARDEDLADLAVALRALGSRTSLLAQVFQIPVLAYESVSEDRRATNFWEHTRRWRRS